MTYSELRRSLEVWPGSSDPEYLQQIDTIIRQAESRIGMLVEIPAYQKTVAVTLIGGTNTVSAPADFKSLDWVFFPNIGNLEMKSQGFILEAFPDPTDSGPPRFVGMKDEKTLIFGPTPDTGYTGSMQYFGKWPSIVDVPTGTFISDTFEGALLHGSLYQADLFMKDYESAQAEKQEMMDSLGLLTTFAKDRANKQESEKPNSAID